MSSVASWSEMVSGKVLCMLTLVELSAIKADPESRWGHILRTAAAWVVYFLRCWAWNV